MRPVVRMHRHQHWTAIGVDYLTLCKAGLWTVTFDGKQTTTHSWAEAMEFANTLARSQRPVEVLARAVVDSSSLTPEAGAA